MRITTSDKIIAWLTLFSGLTISAVAIYYSVAGLVAIFAAAAIPIMVMGVVLELSKLIATVWLKMNWKRAPWFIKTYLISAITVLMIITSMGIFGYLSKAHSDQSLVSGDVQSKIALYDEKIKIERENIDNAQQVIKQMDAAVNGVISTGDREVKLKDGSTKVNSAAERSLQIRRSQAKDRAKLTKEIEDAQNRIIKMQEEAAPIRAEVRKVEAEVGPIKYIAALIYGDNPDTNLLERAVRIVIIVIVAVFDPLAVILLLSSQYSFQWFREKREEEEDIALNYEPDDGVPTEDQVEQINETVVLVERDLVAEGNAAIAEIEPEVPEFIPPEPVFDEKKPLDDWNEMIAEAEKAAEEEKEQEDHDILEGASASEKAAMTAWKKDNPDSSLKIQRRLFDRGVISKLPWEEYLKPQADFADDEAAAEAAKWAQEQLEKKQSGIAWMEHDTEGNQIKKTLEGYQQNAEQTESTLWQRVKKAKDEQ